MSILASQYSYFEGMAFLGVQTFFLLLFFWYYLSNYIHLFIWEVVHIPWHTFGGQRSPCRVSVLLTLCVSGTELRLPDLVAGASTCYIISLTLFLKVVVKYVRVNVYHLSYLQMWFSDIKSLHVVPTSLSVLKPFSSSQTGLYCYHTSRLQQPPFLLRIL